ncbi:MAG: M23 family metallopeptidase [Patescibacteria group bacterium]|nr:M23 family metallopeptidase [Patescibacteria group bacterium]
MKKILIMVLALALISLGVFGVMGKMLAATAETRVITFPTDPTVTFTDDFGDARSGHLHEANDLMGKKMTPLYAAVDGRVHDVEIPEASWGYAITLEDADGYTYHYLHVNNDTPGTDDGLGGVKNAYAPGIVRGATVTKGQLIGWMGDSGNAENVGSHLHFEIRRPDGTAIDPYLSLVAARDLGSYNVAAALAGSPNINTDKGLAAGGGIAPCVSGSLIKIPIVSAVYYCGADGKRHVFTHANAFFTWYKDFNGILTITPEQLAAIPLGSNVTYRPGVKLIKSPSGSQIYAVGKGGVLRWIRSEATAASLYGADWKKKIDIVPDAFITNYTEGDPI